MKKKKKQYWMCIIGPADPNEYKGNGADFPMREGVRDAFINMFGNQEDVLASGWGIDEERYEVLRALHVYSTEKLKEALNHIRNEQ